MALLRAGRAETMSDETRRKVLAGIGVGGAALGLAVSSSVGNGSAGWVSWPAWLKTGLVLSALGGIAGTLAFFGLGSPQPQQVSAPKSPAAAVQPAVVQPPAAAQPAKPASPTNPGVEPGVPVYQATDLPVDPGQLGVTKPSGASKNESSAAVAPSLAAELDAIRPAKARLASGDARGALTQIRQYRAEFPNGKLGVEATVIEVEALVALGQRGAAERLAAPLLKGDSPYAARLRTLLGQNSAPKP
jgi:hypothetical protein